MRFLPPAGLAALALLMPACTSPTVVTTDDAAPSTNPAPAPAAPTARPSNEHLANAFDYAAEVDGQTAYYFVSPSGRWECAIIPRTRAGCQNAQASALEIAGSPDEVAGPDGELTAPTAIAVDRTAAPQFLANPAPGFAPVPGPVAELPFNRILAVAGFRCNVQETAGISCLSEFSGLGFTFSADGFTTTYTDVPAGAP